MARKKQPAAKKVPLGIFTVIVLLLGLGIFLTATQMDTDFRQEAASKSKNKKKQKQKKPQKKPTQNPVQTPTATPMQAKYFKYTSPASTRAPEESFIVAMTDQDDINNAMNNSLIVSGVVKEGDGGFNISFGQTPSGSWSWYLDPSTITFGQYAMEVCDGRPSFVERTRSEWLGHRFCPWNARMTAVYDSPPM